MPTGERAGIWGIVLAAGLGGRFGGAKQFASLGGRRLVDRVVDTAAAVCEGVVVVLPSRNCWDGPRVAAAVDGGATRSQSVRNGLGAVDRAAELVIVCDAAHPLAGEHLFRDVIDAVAKGADAAVPVLPLSETLKRIDGARVVESVSRTDVVLAQTPAAFRSDVLRAAHEGNPEAQEDTILVEAMGGRITAVPGDPVNIHVTTRRELWAARRLVTLRPMAGDDTPL